MALSAPRLIPFASGRPDWDHEITPADLGDGIRSNLASDLGALPDDVALAAALPSPTPEISEAVAAAVAALWQLRESAEALALALERHA